MSIYLKSIKALYSCDYVRRLKVCKFCSVEFSDITKRNLRNTCSDKCDYASMVLKRHEKNNYAQTNEQKEKKRVASTLMHATRDVFSEEARKIFSETMKKTWREGKIDTSKHWTKTPEGKEKISKNSKGRIYDLEARANMSIGAQNRVRTKRETLYSSAKGGYREDLKCYFRSTWEANFARILNFQNRKWEYECKTFQLEDSLSYTPDFYIEDENVFYELKGRLDERSKLQLGLMKEKYPEVIVNLIEGESYNKLRLEFKDLVEWEGK